MNKAKKRRISRLSLKFTIVAVGAAILSIALFATLFYNRYRVFYIFNDHITIDGKTSDSTSKDISTLQKTIDDLRLSKNDSRQIHHEMRELKEYSLFLYDGEQEVDKEQLISSLERQSYLETSSFMIRLYDPPLERFSLKFYDGQYDLFVYSYRGLVFIQRYLMIGGGFCLLLFFTLIMIFVHYKMRSVLAIGEEMKYIEEGNYHREINCKGDDEIGNLAGQLDHLRSTLYTKIVSEEEAREANEELVTAMSHDLRTPLTSLMGYLDILDMKIYKNDEQRDSYIKKSKNKAEQIKNMSDKLFTHFLMYAQKDDVELAVMDEKEISKLLAIFCDELKELHFNVYEKYDYVPFRFQGDLKFLERIFDNLFSNICKYASKEMVVVSMNVHEFQVSIKIKNKTKKESDEEESNNIGFKSIQKMMNVMKGSILVEDFDEYFSVQLSFPCSTTLKSDK